MTRSTIAGVTLMVAITGQQTSAHTVMPVRFGSVPAGVGQPQAPRSRRLSSRIAFALSVILAFVVHPAAGLAQPADTAPTSSLLLLIDVSGSMDGEIGNGNPEIKITAAKQAASDAARRAVSRNRVEIAILAFEGTCSRPVPRHVNFTSDIDVLERFIDSLQPGGGTPMAPALLFANRFMKSEGAPAARDQMIVLLADGQNDCGSVADAMSELSASGVIFRHETVGFGIAPDSVAAQDLRDIATTSGGAYHHAADATQLGDLLAEFVDTFSVIDLLGTFARPGTASPHTVRNASSPEPPAPLTEFLGRFRHGDRQQATTSPPEDFHIAVAANSIGSQVHTFRLAWGFGYHSASGNEASHEARSACNTQGRGGCSNLGTPSMRGGCAAVAQGTWTEQGRAPQVRLYAGTSTLGRDAAAAAAMTHCRAFTGAGLAPGALLRSDCVPLAVVCSSDVGRR